MVVVRALTGPRRLLSTPGLARMPAALRARPQLREVVGHRHPQLGPDRGVVLGEVAERGADAGSFHRDRAYCDACAPGRATSPLTGMKDACWNQSAELCSAWPLESDAGRNWAWDAV